MCCSPYKSAWDCTRSVYNNEGLRAFYRSYTTMLSMNIPFQVYFIHIYIFIVYIHCKIIT